jgi:hypothetical protein
MVSQLGRQLLRLFGQIVIYRAAISEELLQLIDDPEPLGGSVAHSLDITLLSDDHFRISLGILAGGGTDI